jgi:hypothetical protein
MLADRLEQKLPVDAIEEALDVEIKHPVVAPAALAGLCHGINRRFAGPVTPKQAERYRALIPKDHWKEWQVPFDSDPDWPKPLQEALAAYREAWRAKMDDVSACIAANVEMEELVD